MSNRNAEELFPRAVEQFRHTASTASELIETIYSNPSALSFAENVIIFPTMTGQVVWNLRIEAPAFADFRLKLFQIQDSAQLTLNSLLSEAGQIFRSQWRGSGRHDCNAFPITDDPTKLYKLFESGVAEGLPTELKNAIARCQPFDDLERFGTIEKISRGLNSMLHWDNARKSDLQLGIALIPGKFAYSANPPITLTPHFLTEDTRWFTESGDYIATRFIISGAERGDAIRVSSIDDLHIDFCTPNPVDLHTRVSELITSLQNILGLFAYLTSRSPLSKSFVEETAEHVDGQRLTVFWINEDEDFSIHRIRHASRILEGDSFGHSTEESIESAAATWGLPDFVMRPIQERKGAAVREISDGLVISGKKGLIIQSKARENPSNDDPEKEVRWVNKQIKKASAQVEGTARRLNKDPITVRNGRNRELLFEAGEIDWAGAIIIENPAIQKCEINDLSCKIPLIILTRADWEFLFEKLRSTHSVVEYAFRAGNSLILGEEYLRYFQLADADLQATREATPATYDSWHPHSSPALPILGSSDDDLDLILRDIMEDISLSVTTKSDYIGLHSLLSNIDAIPLTVRPSLSDLLSKGLQTAGETPNLWRARHFRLNGFQVGFAVFGSFSDQVNLAFQSWATYRHSLFLHSPGTDPSSTSTFVLLTPSSSQIRTWDTTAVHLEDDPNLSSDDIALFSSLFDKPETPTGVNAK